MGFVKSTIKMSWSFTTSGTTEEVVSALEQQSNVLSDQSKEEFDSALPHLIALVKENVGGKINVNAYGHGVKNADGIFYDKSCSVNITR
jgi:hypothetical protein